MSEKGFRARLADIFFRSGAQQQTEKAMKEGKAAEALKHARTALPEEETTPKTSNIDPARRDRLIREAANREKKQSSGESDS